MTTGNEVLDVNSEAERQAQAIIGRVTAPTGNRIRVQQNKMFEMPDGTQNPGPLSVVVVEFAGVNNFYTKPYVEGQISPPDCFAINLDVNSMVPSDKSPAKQAESCAVCPHNQFKSAPNGRGKMCRNTRLLAVLPPDATEDTPIWTLALSPTACGPFDEQVGKVARAFKGPLWKVISEIGFDPSVSYPSIRFGRPKLNPEAALALNRQAEAKEILMREPDIASMLAAAADNAPPPRTPPSAPRAPRGAIRR